MKIYLFEPASPSDPKTIEEALAFFNNEFPSHEKPSFSFIGQIGMVNPELPYLAWDDTLKAKTFIEASRKKEACFIWATRGGYGTLRWLGLVDFSSLASSLSNKLFMGFSDVTFLASQLTNMGLKFLHAPMLSTFLKSNPESRQAFYSFLRTGRTPLLAGVGLKQGSCVGRVIGGNLTCICHSIGTKYEPQWHDSILFIEDCWEDLYKIDRMLTHLIECGALDKVQGIALGSFLFSDNEKEQTKMLPHLFADRLAPLEKPIVMDLPVGHGSSNMPILLGGMYELDGTSGTLTPWDFE